MRQYRHPKPSKYAYQKLISKIMPLLILLPACIVFISDFSGITISDAFHQSLHTISSPFLWASIALCALITSLYLRPVTRFYCTCSDPTRCRVEDAELVIKRVNSLGFFSICVSIFGFMSGEIIGMIATGNWRVFNLARQFMFLNEAAKGFLTGVIISFNLDNMLFVAKKTALAMHPKTKLKRKSLYRKIFVIIAAIVVYLLFQLFSTSAHFFELGEGFYGELRQNQGIEHFLGETMKAPEMRASMHVFLVKVAFYVIIIFQLVMQIKMMIRHPINAIRNRLALLNANDAAKAEPVDIVSNDEFTDALREINVLIERQRAELESSSYQLEKIVDQAADPIISFNGNGRILLFNPAAELFFGWTEDEAKKTSVAELLGIPSIDAWISEDDHRGGGIKRFTAAHRDGTKRTFESNVSSVTTNGKTVYTAILRDISIHLELEENLKEAKIGAENANRLKSEFLANMSHELRTPLNAVLGFTQLLGNDSNLTDGQKEKLGIISRSGEHLLALINDILDISKIEAGKTELHETVFSLADFVNDIREMFSLRCQKANLSLYVEFTGEIPPRVRGDLGKLRQVLINLVGNAVKFTAEGGISITVGPDDVESDKAGDSASANAGGRIRFAVSDSGKGIPSDELELIMQPFRQSSLTDNEGGTGLGLAISTRYIQMMGGSLSVTSKVGEGSTFSFSIPLSETDEEIAGSKDEPVAIAVKKGKEITALIVDDKELNRLVLKEMLVQAGFSTVEAENGKQAVERTAEFRPQIIFMDIKMPVMDGYGAVSLLKANESTKSIPVFALTASAFVNDEKKILAAGFDGFLAKPFKKSSLFALIRDKSGLDLEYETGEAAPAGGVPNPDSVDWASAAKKLGPEGIAEIADCALINDFTGIRAIANRIKGDLPELAALMLYHAGSYDEAALEKVSESLKAAI